MKQIIQDLTKLLNDAGDFKEASRQLQKSAPRFSPRAAQNVMQDVQEHVDGLIDETQLSLYLKQHGFGKVDDE